MVYDWFNRQSEAAPTPPPADDSASAQEPQQDAAASADDDPLEWARQAYARLKAQKEQANATPAAPQSDSPAEPETKPEPEPEREPEQEPAPADPEPTPVAGLSLLEQAAAQRQERQQQLEQEPQVAQEPVAEQPVAAASVEVDREQDEPSLGAFDDTFTWSAEVLAAQGREAEQVTLEEIDWLGRLRQGLEKTRQGFVSGLLENLGDDPLTPEVLDDLESLLLRADAGVKATDQVLDALRKRMNEQVVDPSEGIRFLKEQLRDLLEAPIKSSGVDLLALSAVS